MSLEQTLFVNYAQLTDHGQQAIRRDALAIMAHGLQAAIPYDKTREIVRYEDGAISVAGETFPLAPHSHVYVVGVGKGSYPIAKALDEILGDRIDEGFVVVKEGETRRLPHIELFESAHPIPDERSITGARRIRDILQKAKAGDLVFAAITGGSSAMVNLIPENISLADLQRTNDLLLKCGASIAQINSVRKHLCGMKGGRVVAMAQPAHIVTLTLDTAPADMPWPEMCLADPTTFSDAISACKSYEIWDKLPPSVREHLCWGVQHPEAETLKSLQGMHQSLYGVTDQRVASQAMCDRAAEMGYTPHLLSTVLEGEAKDAGIFFSALANEIIRTGRPFAAPCALISAGETTVTIGDTCGEGGPNQETTLGFVTKLHVDAPICCISLDSDGTDGPCDHAGGIADALSARRCRECGIDVTHVLKTHDSLSALKALGDAIYTGHTGTNVMNLRLVLIGNEEEA